MNLLIKTPAIRKTILSDGLIILSENLPNYSSVSFGVWIKSGSRDEASDEMGMAHFLEHMLFQGTENRTSFEIAHTLESVGGSINAFTGKEETCFYAHSLPQHLPLAVDLLGDMICRPLLSEEGIGKEKAIIREEINAVFDTPDEYLLDILQEKIYPGHSLGYAILGDNKSISAFSRRKIESFWRRHYRPDNIIVSAAGDVDHDRLVEMIVSAFNFPSVAKDKLLNETAELPPAAFGEHIINADVSQVHLSLGFRTDSYNSAYRIPLIAVNHYLGEGMSARLFRVLREEHAYVYSVYSFADFFKDSGMFGVYLGTEIKNAHQAKKLVLKEFSDLKSVPLSDDVIENLKNRLEGGLLLSLETTFKHMARLFKSYIYFGHVRVLKTVITEIHSISNARIRETVEAFYDDEKIISVLLSRKEKI